MIMRWEMVPFQMKIIRLLMESYVSQVARTVSFDHPPCLQRAPTFENVMPQWPKAALFTQNKNTTAKSVFYAITSAETDASDSLLAMLNEWGGDCGTQIQLISMATPKRVLFMGAIFFLVTATMNVSLLPVHRTTICPSSTTDFFGISGEEQL